MSKSKILTPSEVAEIEARERLATKGPWTKYYRVSPRGAYKNWHIGNKDGACQITLNGHERDYDFMAHAREDIPALCATVRHLLSENEKLTKTNTGLFCNGCGSLIEGWPSVFRCVTPGCGRIYHEQCLLSHCAVEVADLAAERDRLKDDLRVLTQGRFIQS